MTSKAELRAQRDRAERMLADVVAREAKRRDDAAGSLFEALPELVGSEFVLTTRLGRHVRILVTDVQTESGPSGLIDATGRFFITPLA